MKKKYKGLIFVLVLVLVFVVFWLKNENREEVRQLKSVEIKEYEGEKLSSVYDFRENSIKGVQYIDIDDYELRVFGLVDVEKKYKYNEVLNRGIFSKVVKLNCVEGWSATILWEGIKIADLLRESKPKSSANTVIFYAVDGYTTSFPVEYIMNSDLLLAHKMNGEVMIPERGFPFQLVAEDRWGYKWIKWITAIEFSDDESYEGYWESRGYSNSGDLKGGILK